MKTLLKHLPAFAFAPLLLMLVACDKPVAKPEPKMAQVRMQSASHTIVFGDGATRLNLQEHNALRGFLSTVPPAAVSDATLAADDTNPRGAARAKSVRDHLIRYGFAKNVIHIAHASGIDPRTVVLNVQYARAIPPQDCPDWSKNSTANYENTDASGFGCAYYNNLIVQLANPADYNGAHATQVSSGARDSVFIDRYFSGTAQTSSSTSGSTGNSSSGAASGGTGGATSSP